MKWMYSHRFDPDTRLMADRHYNRQKVGSKQFVPPGRCVVLVIPDVAFWVTYWPEFVTHAWPGAWVCSAFRNERRDLFLSSSLIEDAIAATLAAPHTETATWSTPPEAGMITFVNEEKVKHKRDPGRCFRKAGFDLVGRTKENNLLAFQLPPAKFPAPCPALTKQLSLFA